MVAQLVPNDHINNLIRRITVASAYLAARQPEQALQVLNEADLAARAAGIEVGRLPLRLTRCVALTRLGRLAEAAAEYAALESIMARAPALEQARAHAGPGAAGASARSGIRCGPAANLCSCDAEKAADNVLGARGRSR